MDTGTLAMPGLRGAGLVWRELLLARWYARGGCSVSPAAVITDCDAMRAHRTTRLRTVSALSSALTTSSTRSSKIVSASSSFSL